MTPRAAYARLLRRFGPQGWWPVRGRYRPGFWGRLTRAERAEICVGAILTQNTAWTNVEKALANLRRARAAGDLGALARMPERRLASLIRPSGYFNQKAKKLKLFARWALGRSRYSRGELLALWGIGPETADSILLYAQREPVFVIDAYTLRVGRRLGWFRETTSYAQAQEFLSRLSPQGDQPFGEFHALFVELAKRHCRKTPECSGCPLKGGCAHAQAL